MIFSTTKGFSNGAIANITKSFIRTKNSYGLATNPMFFNQNILGRSFSQLFREADEAEMRKFDEDIQLPKKYVKARDLWQVPLARKQARRLRKIEALKNFVPPADDIEKFVVHAPGLPLELPTKDADVFAVATINGRQYKIFQDDIIVTELPSENDLDVNDHVIFDHVLMIGAKDFTLVGRPLVQDARVYATVEQITQGKKTLLFWKKRRKGYKKHRGHRQNLMTFRIDKIDYELTQDKHFDNAVGFT